MTLLLIVLTWLVIGAAVGVVEARRGHWSSTWVVTAVLGPFAIPYAIQLRRRARQAAPQRLATGLPLDGHLDVLVGIDGSPASRVAARMAVQLLNRRIRRLTLAHVLDYDAANPPDGSPLAPPEYDDVRAAEAELREVADELRAVADVTAGTVLLAGEPATALQDHAVAEGHDLLVVGCRGRGMAKLVLGSCASRLACSSRVPVMLIPEEPAAAVTELRVPDLDTISA